MDDDVKTLLVGIGTMLAAHTARFDKIDARLDKVEGRLDTFDARFDKIDATLAVIQQDSAEIRQATSVNHIRVSARVETLERRLDDHLLRHHSQ